MATSTVLIFGATGNIGGARVEHLIPDHAAGRLNLVGATCQPQAAWRFQEHGIEARPVDLDLVETEGKARLFRTCREPKGSSELLFKLVLVVGSKGLTPRARESDSTQARPLRRSVPLRVGGADYNAVLGPCRRRPKLGTIVTGFHLIVVGRRRHAG